MRRVNVPLFDELQAVFDLGFLAARVNPIEIGHQVDRANIFFRIAMALQAPAHAVRLGVLDHFHLVHLAVALDAGNASVYVDGVVEKRVVREVVHADPAHRFAVGQALADRGQLLAVPLDGLYDLRSVTGSTADFQIISCYRSPNTNEMLRSKSKGVAKNSMHIKGQAIDIRLTGYSTKKLREAALKLGRGGVGYYPGSNFIHVDTGRVRRW